MKSKDLHTEGRGRSSISLYGDNLNNHFFITEIEEFAQRYQVVYVFLRYGIGEPKHSEEIHRLPNVTVLDLSVQRSARAWKPITFLLYLFRLLPWKKVFDVASMKAAIVNAAIGWRTACQVPQSGLRSHFHLSFWGRSPEFLVALKSMNPEYVVGTRLHSFDLYFSLATKLQLSTRLKALNALDFVAPISVHGANHLKAHGVTTLSRVSYLGCRANEFLFLFKEQRSAKKSSECLKIATIAKVAPVKRLDYTVDVLNRLGSRVVWHQYGRLSINEKDTDHVNLVRNKVRKSNSKRRRLEMKGDVSNEELRKALIDEKYDFVLLLSESEGVPVSLMEALAADIRIVVTDTNGCSELVQNDIGCLIPVEASVAECAHRIEQWLDELSGTPHDGLALDFWKSRFDSAVLYDDFVEFVDSLPVK
ncbi:glycosyltransferase [Flavobacteriales bacterium]|nr:glycosyltransferase [Flavobacteriales bacterium]